MQRRTLITGLVLSALLSACSASQSSKADDFDPPLHANETPELRHQINHWADHYEVPRELVHRLAIRESHHRPEAINRPYYGLLQIHPATARGMGFQGQPADLLTAETNLEFAVKYLRGAWLLADGSHDAAIRHYSSGYYYEAKRRGMLVETGLAPG